MKKITFFLSISFAFTLFFTSCQSTKTEPQAANETLINKQTNTVTDITDETESVDISETYKTDEVYDADESDEYEEYTTSDSEKEVGTITTDKKKSLISFGNVDKFILLDNGSFFTPNAFGKPTQVAYTITVEPKEQLVGFGSKYLLAYYIITMDKKNRNLYKQAVQSYLMDFENKKLDRKNRKSNMAYGKFEVTGYWGSIKTSTPNYGTGRAYLGYKFVENSPYFTITVPEIYNIYFEKVNNNADPGSLNLTYYFTKAQAKELAKLLDEDNINEIISDYLFKETGIIQSADEY